MSEEVHILDILLSLITLSIIWAVQIVSHKHIQPKTNYFLAFHQTYKFKTEMYRNIFF